MELPLFKLAFFKNLLDTIPAIEWRILIFIKLFISEGVEKMPKKKTGLMYSGNFADYKAGDGYLCMSAGFNPWMATNDYYDTPERVTEAYDLV